MAAKPPRDNKWGVDSFFPLSSSSKQRTAAPGTLRITKLQRQVCVSTGRHHSRPQNFLLAVLNLCWVKPQMLKVTLHNQYQTTIKPASGSSPSAMHPYASSYPGQLALVWLLSTPFSCQTIPEAVVVDSVVYEAFIEEAVTKNYGNPARELSCLVCWGERRSGTCSQRSWLSWVSTMDLLGRDVGEGMGRGNSKSEGSHLKVEEQRGKETCFRTSPAVQWLRLHDPNAGGLASIPGQGTRSPMLQTSKTEDPTFCS